MTEGIWVTEKTWPTYVLSLQGSLDQGSQEI